MLVNAVKSKVDRKMVSKNG